MNETIKKLQAKLDGLAIKKTELVKQRDAEKVEAEKTKTKAGYDFLDGGTIDAIGGNLQKVRARIETIESGINACAATMAEVDQELKAAWTEWAKDRAADVSKDADKILAEVINGYVELAIKAKALQGLKNEMRHLANDYHAPIEGQAVHEDIGFIFTNLQTAAEQLKRLDPEIRNRIPRLI